jgi:hypothetical protein
MIIITIIINTCNKLCVEYFSVFDLFLQLCRNNEFPCRLLKELKREFPNASRVLD